MVISVQELFAEIRITKLILYNRIFLGKNFISLFTA